MKKAKIIALILVMSLMLTGGAYALWNQNITLTTAADTGVMDVSVMCAQIYSLSTMQAIPGPNWYDGYTDDYMNLSCGITNQTHGIQVTVDHMYPGAKYGINFTIKNTGTVPVKLQDVIIARASGDAGLFAQLKGGFSCIYQPATGLPTTIVLPPSSSGYTIATLGTAIKTACSNVILYPNDQLISCPIVPSTQDRVSSIMQVSLSDTITGNDYENANATFTIDFAWQQCPVTVA